MKFIYFTFDVSCPAHPDEMFRCTRAHGPIPGNWASIKNWNGVKRIMGHEEVKETEPPFAADE